MDDLHIPDPDTTDAITKLPTNMGLNLKGKVIVIHGVPVETILPSTVETILGVTNTTTLPIACGVIH